MSQSHGSNDPGQRRGRRDRPYRKDPFRKDAYRKDAYRKDPYGKEPFRKDGAKDGPKDGAEEHRTGDTGARRGSDRERDRAQRRAYGDRRHRSGSAEASPARSDRGRPRRDRPDGSDARDRGGAPDRNRGDGPRGQDRARRGFEDRGHRSGKPGAGRERDRGDRRRDAVPSAGARGVPERAPVVPRRASDALRPAPPPLPADLDPRSLDAEVRGQLRALAKGVAEQVSLRLVAAGELIDVEPELALAHALVARRLASRIPAVREAAGLAAYRAGQWQTAIGELRAYHRMAGRQSHLAVLADCERALGRPERAIDLYRAADRSQLAPDEAAELLIVAAGARADLGQKDAAVAMLQVRELTSDEPWAARLRYAYADALLAVGRAEEAREWFSRAAEIDEDAMTDAAERLLALDGVVLDDTFAPDTFFDDEQAFDDEHPFDDEQAFEEAEDTSLDDEADGPDR